jgi:hypothetical protein
MNIAGGLVIKTIIEVRSQVGGEVI